MWEKINKYYPAWWELLLLFLLFLSFWYPYVHYAELPARVPTHFGPAGFPDAWSPKSPVHVFDVHVIIAVIYIFFTGMMAWMASLPDPKKIINASKWELDRMSPERAEQIRQVTIRGLFAIKALIVSMNTYLAYASIQVALGKTAGLGWYMWVFVAGLTGAALYLAVLTMQLVYGRDHRPR